MPPPFFYPVLMVSVADQEQIGLADNRQNISPAICF